MPEVKLTRDKIGKRFLMEICRADWKRTTSQSILLLGSTTSKYWVLIIRSTSLVNWRSNRGKTTATPQNTLLPRMSENLPTSSTTRPLNLGASVKQAKKQARPCNISSYQDSECSTTLITTVRPWNQVMNCIMATNFASVTRKWQATLSFVLNSLTKVSTRYGNTPYNTMIWTEQLTWRYLPYQSLDLTIVNLSNKNLFFVCFFPPFSFFSFSLQESRIHSTKKLFAQKQNSTSRLFITQYQPHIVTRKLHWNTQLKNL